MSKDPATHSPRPTPPDRPAHAGKDPYLPGPGAITPKDLHALSLTDVVSIDAAIAAVARHGFGEVVIVIADGSPKYVKPAPSIQLGRGLGCDIRIGPV